MIRFNDVTRAYIYRVLLSVQALAIGYGLITEEAAALWVNVVSAVLGLGLAVQNTSTKNGVI